SIASVFRDIHLEHDHDVQFLLASAVQKCFAPTNSQHDKPRKDLCRLVLAGVPFRPPTTANSRHSVHSRHFPRQSTIHAAVHSGVVTTEAIARHSHATRHPGHPPHSRATASGPPHGTGRLGSLHQNLAEFTPFLDSLFKTLKDR